MEGFVVFQGRNFVVVQDKKAKFGKLLCFDVYFQKPSIFKIQGFYDVIMTS